MKLYLKITLSTLVGSFIFALVLALIGLMVFPDAREEPLGVVYFIGIAAVVGFTMYGIIGSITWAVVHRYMFESNGSIGSHVISAALGVVVLFVLLGVAYLLRIIDLETLKVTSIYPLPGAIFSVLVHGYMYHRIENRS